MGSTELARPDRSTAAGRLAQPATGASPAAHLWAEAAIRGLCLAFVCTLTTLALQAAVLCVAFGWQPMAIISDSMAPSLMAGDVVLLDRTVERDALAAGSIVTFQDPARPGRTTTHRLEGRDADGRYRTRGDGNDSADSTPVAPEQIEGVARVIVPSLGRPVAWLHDGRWWALAVTAAATVVAIQGLRSPAVAPSRARRRARRKLPWAPAPGGRLITRAALVAAVLAVAVQALPAATPAAAAPFSGTTATGPNALHAAASFDGLGSGGSAATTYRDVVMADAPAAYWRLGESAVTVFQDDFETFSGWTDYGTGTVQAASDRAHTGSASGKKDLNNDPNGGWKALGTTMGNSWVFETWLYRPSGAAGGQVDRVGLEDGSFNGYTLGVDHTGNAFQIDRRTSGSATKLSSVAVDPPEDTWFRVVLVRNGSELFGGVYAADGTTYVELSTADATHSTFDRVTVRGGHAYYLDDLVVSNPGADEQLVHQAQYLGVPEVGTAGLITGDSDTAVRLDGVDDVVAITDHADINLGTYTAKTVELWFSADEATPRQVLWEQGGTVNGMSIYLDAGTLYARAWSEGQAWSSPLQVSRPIADATRYHVVAVLDATGGTLRLYTDGTLWGTATKTDGNSLPAHNDDVGIGRVRGNTEFHDGDSLGGAHAFQGVIDEVAVYNAVLDASRVADHYGAGR